MKLINYLSLKIFSLLGIFFFLFLLFVFITEIFPNEYIYFSLNDIAIAFVYFMLFNSCLILFFTFEIFIKKFIKFSIKLNPVIFYLGFVLNVFFICIYLLLINA